VPPALPVAGVSPVPPCSVSTSRSSNRACGFAASGSPTGFTNRHTAAPDGAPFAGPYSSFRSRRALARVAGPTGQTQGAWSLREHTRSQAPSLRRHYPAATVLRACPPALGGPACPARASGWREFPRSAGASRVASFTLRVSRPAQRSLTLRPAGSRDRLAVLGIEGFGNLVTSSAAPIAAGRSESCRAGITAAEERRLVTPDRE